MSIEQQENFLDIFVEELKKMNPKQIDAWLKEERDNQLLIKAADVLQEDIDKLPRQEKGELSRKRSAVMKRLQRNKKTEATYRSEVVSGLSKKKTEFNV